MRVNRAFAHPPQTLIDRWGSMPRRAVRLEQRYLTLVSIGPN